MKKIIMMMLCAIAATFTFSAFGATNGNAMSSKASMVQQMSQPDQAAIKMMGDAVEKMMNKKMSYMGVKMMMMGMKMYMMGDMMITHNMGDASKAKEMMLMGANMYKMGNSMTGGKGISDMPYMGKRCMMN